LIATDFEAALLEVMIVEKSPAPAAAFRRGASARAPSRELARRMCDNI
jgi:hypothetical protein